MAKMAGGLGDGLRGKLGGLSYYKMRGVDKVIVRESGGHTKRKIKKDPDLDLFRRAGSEFGGRALMSSFIMRALVFQKPMADYNLAGPLSALMKPIQEQDRISELGQRNIYLSEHAQYIKGFSLNRNHSFDSVIRFPVTGTIDRETLSASVTFPELMPDINFFPAAYHPYYALRITLAIVPDIVYNQNRYTPIHANYPDHSAEYVDSTWYSSQEGSPAQTMMVKVKTIPPDTHFTLVLAVGVCYGKLKTLSTIERVARAGSAKVLEVGSELPVVPADKPGIHDPY